MSMIALCHYANVEDAKRCAYRFRRLTQKEGDDDQVTACILSVRSQACVLIHLGDHRHERLMNDCLATRRSSEKTRHSGESILGSPIPGKGREHFFSMFLEQHE